MGYGHDLTLASLGSMLNDIQLKLAEVLKRSATATNTEVAVVTELYDNTYAHCDIVLQSSNKTIEKVPIAIPLRQLCQNGMLDVDSHVTVSYNGENMSCCVIGLSSISVNNLDQMQKADEPSELRREDCFCKS